MNTCHTNGLGPFRMVRTYHLARPTGDRVRDAEGLLLAARTAPEAILERHLLQCYLRPEFEASGYPNDFAIWAADNLGDHALAEALSGLHPYRSRDWEEIRSRLVEAIEGRLWEDDSYRRVRPGRELFLEDAVTIVIETGVSAKDVNELRDLIAGARPGDLFHHVHRAGFESADCRNDFATWVEAELGLGDLAGALAAIDFPYFTLEELRAKLLATLEDQTGVRS